MAMRGAASCLRFSLHRGLVQRHASAVPLSSVSKQLLDVDSPVTPASSEAEAINQSDWASHSDMQLPIEIRTPVKTAELHDREKILGAAPAVQRLPGSSPRPGFIEVLQRGMPAVQRPVESSPRPRFTEILQRGMAAKKYVASNQTDWASNSDMHLPIEIGTPVKMAALFDGRNISAEVRADVVQRLPGSSPRTRFVEVLQRGMPATQLPVKISSPRPHFIEVLQRGALAVQLPIETRTPVKTAELIDREKMTGAAAALQRLPGSSPRPCFIEVLQRGMPALQLPRVSSPRPRFTEVLQSGMAAKRYVASNQADWASNSDMQWPIEIGTSVKMAELIDGGKISAEARADVVQRLPGSSPRTRFVEVLQRGMAAMQVSVEISSPRPHFVEVLQRGALAVQLPVEIRTPVKIPV